MLQQLPSSTRRRLDLAGIALSGLCAVHCLLTILIVSGLGLGGHLLLDPDAHRYALGLAIIVAILALGSGAIRHRRADRRPLVAAVSGIVLMSAALAAPHGVLEAALTIVGVALVSVGHFLNMRGTRSQISGCAPRSGNYLDRHDFLKNHHAER